MSGISTRLYQSQQLRQEMKINPRLYQAMELLYMPLLDLQQHLKAELEENPFLEMTEADVEDDVELEEGGEDDPPDDEIDWEGILLDGFDVGGRREQYEPMELYHARRWRRLIFGITFTANSGFLTSASVRHASGKRS